MRSARFAHDFPASVFLGEEPAVASGSEIIDLGIWGRCLRRTRRRAARQHQRPHLGRRACTTCVRGARRGAEIIRT
jgi:hypothetical protein